jgi:hypothetical protein
MDSTQDLILGVMGGTWVGVYGYPGIEAYVESIKRSEFVGRKVMLCWGIRTEVRAKLIEYGFELVNLPQPNDPFFHARMRVCYEYLKEHHQEFRYIFWLDIKDLILQNDPSKWMEQNLGEHTLVAATEPIPIMREETNWLWARTILGETRAHEIKDCLVLNGGVFAGKAEEMTEVFHQTHLLCYPYGGPYPPCQISMNYVMHTMLNKELHIPQWSEGFAACLHPCWSPWRVPCWTYMRDPHPVLDSSTCTLHSGTIPNPSNPMVMFNSGWGINRRIQITIPSHPLQGLECSDKPEGKAFSIVHGYDRDWDVKSMFEFRYRFGGGFDLASYKVWNEELAQHSPQARRGLRCVKREKPIGNSQLSQSGRVFSRNT